MGGEGIQEFRVEPTSLEKEVMWRCTEVKHELGLKGHQEGGGEQMGEPEPR